MGYLFNDPNKADIRKKLRNNLGLPEIIIWNHLKGQKLGKKFRRQYGVGSYVLDFYCPELRLGIELDGESHNSDTAYQNDQKRQQVIEKQGIKVIRFLNKDVLNNLSGVLEEIKRYLG